MMVMVPRNRLLNGTNRGGDGAERRGRGLFNGCLRSHANLRRGLRLLEKRVKRRSRDAGDSQASLLFLRKRIHVTQEVLNKS